MTANDPYGDECHFPRDEPACRDSRQRSLPEANSSVTPSNTDGEPSSLTPPSLKPSQNSSDSLPMADVTFDDLFDLAEIQKIQDAFAAATNVASIITRPDGTPITKPSNFCRLCQDIIRKTEKGLANCYRSDASIGRQNPEGPTVQPCLSGGLWDAGASISVGGKHIANWLIGQVKNEEIDEEKMSRYARDIGADEEQFLAALREVPVMPTKQFREIASALYLFARELSIKAYQNVQQARYIAAQAAISLENARSEVPPVSRYRERGRLGART